MNLYEERAKYEAQAQAQMSKFTWIVTGEINDNKFKLDELESEIKAMIIAFPENARPGDLVPIYEKMIQRRDLKKTIKTLDELLDIARGE